MKRLFYTLILLAALTSCNTKPKEDFIITVKNPNGSQHGVKSVTVNGQKLDGKLIEDKILKEENEVIIEM